jgi:carboxyl-terminal processing protease
MTHESAAPKRRFGWLTLVLLLFALTFACGAGTVAGFAIGRFGLEPETRTETITLTDTVEVEVTREVVVTVETAGSAAGAEVGEARQQEEVAQPTPPAPTPAPTQGPLLPLPEAELARPDFALFDEVWDVIETEFNGPVPSGDDVLYSAIAGSLDTLDDRYTRFVSREIALLLSEDEGGIVSGIGAYVIENEEGFIEIVAPIENLPADRAGLLPGDLVIAVDGTPVTGLTFEEVILRVRGPEGTTVRLTVFRPELEGELEFTVVRTSFEVPVVEAEIIEDNGARIAYLHLTEFNRRAAGSVRDALEELLNQDPEAIILDLRNNPGGFLDQTRLVGDMFLPAGVLLVERDTRGLEQRFMVEDGDAGESLPLLALVNQGSASASEIVAGAIQDSGRGILVGSTTFGKGSVQTIHTLSDGSQLRVTVAQWFTPADRQIHGEGITPDIEVEMSAGIEFGSEEDIQLKRALEYLRSGR